MKKTWQFETKWGKVAFVIEKDMLLPEGMSEADESMMKEGFVSARARKVASLADKAGRAFLGLAKDAKFVRDDWDDVEEAQRIWTKLASENDFRVRDFKEWVSTGNKAVLSAIEKLVARMASEPDYCNDKTAAEILAGLS